MSRILIFGLLILLQVSTVFGQSNKPILVIDNNEYSEAEFWYVYNKNKHLPSFDETPEEFSDRFINYKLKVVEAVNQKLDTTASFINEYNKYADELKASFLVDSSALKSVVEEAMNHMREMVKASHILITLAPNASPKDTLIAWELINEAKDKVEKGADFNEVAVAYSQDPSAVNNKGHLGYFSAFKMIYPFEKAAFSTPKGEVSGIIRTDFGYHIIYVHDKIAHPGEISVAHIMKIFPQNATEEQKDQLKHDIDSIYGLLKKGEDFADLAKQFSDDQQTSQNGGEMQPFSLDNMVPEFANAAFSLDEDNSVSEPVRTDFGWHIIKRLKVIPVVDPKTRSAEIMSRLGRDGRDKAGQKAYLANCISSSRFTINSELKDGLEDRIREGVTSIDDLSVAMGDKLDQVLFSYGKDDFTLQSFIDWLKGFPSEKRIEAVALHKKITDYIDTSVLSIEKRDLAKNNEKYRFLSNEYFDGLLIFEISDREIWSKLGEDTLALKNYYKNNLQEFADHPKLEGTMCLTTSKRLKKQGVKSLNRGESDKLVQILKAKSRSENDCICEEGVFDFIVEATNPINTSLLPESNPYFNRKGDLFWQGVITESDPKPYLQVKGEVMTAYQKQLENDWIKHLREKYKPLFNIKLLR